MISGGEACPRLKNYAYLLLCILSNALEAADNGKARTPPLGWRSWNAFGVNITQQIMMNMMTRMTERVRFVGGKKASLVDLGYTDIGLDDGWQDGGAGVNGSFHDKDGKPLINKGKFPSMSAMVERAHHLGMTAGWYMNNCNPKEDPPIDPAYARKHMRGDVEALIKHRFDGVKLDDCGPYTNLTWWYELINATGQPMLIENCHWGGEGPPCPGGECPYNMWRVSGDITNTWDSMFYNLQNTIAYQGWPRAMYGPGVWAYPDMLEVGKLATLQENRAHFGLWVITSSPLILGFDLDNATIMDDVWEIISNPEAIAVNQNWAGHPGLLAKEQRRTLSQLLLHAVPCSEYDSAQQDWDLKPVESTRPGLYEIVSKSTGKCVDISHQHQITLETCSGSNAQVFAYDQGSGAIRAPFNEVDPNGCFDINGKTGPAVQFTHCYGQPNDAFVFSKNGVWSGGSGVYPYPKRCMQADHATVIDKQVWAKPQPGGAMAVLVVNNDLDDTDFFIDLRSDLNMTNTDWHQYLVRDIWSRTDYSYITDTLSTESIQRRDSMFFLLTPVLRYV